jgi:NAD(P)-dependent dehydrogenase (short-subunit alcohol dehydrogenase family)
MSENGTNEASKIFLVTGAASGIGAATACEMAKRGFTVIGTDVDRDLGEALFAELGAPHAFHLLDVCNEGDWLAVVNDVVATYGRLDILHLNAGVMMRPKGAPILDDPLEWLTADNWRKVSAVNMDGMIFGIIAALKAPGLSRIIMTASGAAIMPLDLDPYYTATKYGELGLALALEKPLAARGVRIDVICPGAIQTGLTAPDIEVAVKQERPEFIAESVATIVTGDAPGPVWMAFTEAQGLERYQPPGLPGMSGALDVTEASEK